MAADAAADLAFLAANARRSIGDLRRAVNEVAAAPGRRGTHFLEVVRTSLDALAEAIDVREQEFGAAADEIDRQSVVRSMRLLGHDIMTLHGYSTVIESARSSVLDLGLVYFVDELVRTIVRGTADVVLVPSPKYMYWTVHRPLAPELHNFGATYPIDCTPVIVAYPHHEPHSLFLHLTIAHELGHSAVTEHRLVAAAYNRHPNATTAQVGDALIAYVASERVTQEVAAAEVATMMKKWITELLCDGLALGFLGPSYLFTFMAFATPLGGPEPYKTHPPNPLRVKWLLGCLRAWGWEDVLTDSVPSLKMWIEGTGTQGSATGAKPYFGHLAAATTVLEEPMRETIEEHLGADRYSPESYAACQGELRDLLRSGVLPAQLVDRSPADRRAAILAGWLEGLDRTEDSPGGLAAVIGDREFQRFLTKALEMSILLEGWSAT